MKRENPKKMSAQSGSASGGKILTIAPTPFFSDRGSHIRIYNEAKYLQKLGAEVLICTYHIGKDVDELSVKRIKKVDWYTKTSPGFSWGKIWIDLKLIWLVKNELKKFQPDIIHAHNFEGLGVGWVASLLPSPSPLLVKEGESSVGPRKVPIVLDLQGDLKSEFESYNKEARVAKKFFVWVSKRLINKADKVVVSSENTLESAKKMYKNPSEIKVIGDGTDLDLFSSKNKINVAEGYDGLKTPLDPPLVRGEKDEESLVRGEKEKSEIKAIKEWKGDSRILIYTGGMEDSKGVGELLEKFINFEIQGWKLLLFGKGEDRRKYARKDVRPYVDGQRDGDYNESETYRNERVWLCAESGYFDLPSYLNLADVTIDPKKDSTESSGKLVNYMATGLPIICFKNRFNQRILDQKGFYMNNIGELENILKNMGSGVRMDYEIDKFSEKKEVQKLHDVFESVQR